MKQGTDPTTVDTLIERITACRVCVDTPIGRPLPHEPRPVLRLSVSASILIAGQAPGTKVHESGRPFDDKSGDRLRDWMGVSTAEFYDQNRIAIVPMGFCFPGQDTKGGDLPPRRECAATWHPTLFASRPPFRLTILLGSHAIAWHYPRLGLTPARTLSETVAQWKPAASQNIFTLPHPSWRNTGWIRRNPWFEDVIVDLRQAVRKELAGYTRGPDHRSV